MSKVKINPGLAAAILLACLFSGWSTLLLVTVLMLIFCEVDDKVKGIAITVIAFYVGLTLVSMGWGLIYDAVGLVTDALTKLVATINCYLDYSNQIDITKLQSYLLTPISNVLEIMDKVVEYFIVLSKFGFIVATLANKAAKENFIVKKINEYVAKVVNYINSIDMPMAQASVQQFQQSPVQQMNSQQEVHQSVEQSNMNNQNNIM